MRNAERKGRTKSQTIFQYFWIKYFRCSHSEVLVLPGTSWNQNHNKICICIPNTDFVKTACLEKLRFLVTKGIICGLNFTCHSAVLCLDLANFLEMFSGMNRIDLLGTHDHTSGLRKCTCKCTCGGLGRTRLGYTGSASPRQSLHLSPSEGSAVNGGNRFEFCHLWLCQELWVPGLQCSRLQSLGTLETAGLKKKNQLLLFKFHIYFFFSPFGGLPSWNQTEQCNLCKKIRVSLAQKLIFCTRAGRSFRYNQEMSGCSQRTNRWKWF